MNHNKCTGGKGKLVLAALSLLTLLTSAEALPFVFQPADLCLGFRKTGSYQGNYECVVDLGPATNYVNLSAGTTINITQYAASQVDPDSFANLTNLSWSVCGYVFTTGSPPGYPKSTLWATQARPSFGVPGVPASRASSIDQRGASLSIESILQGAVVISSELSSNQDNTARFVQEPYSIADGQNYGAFMEDPDYPTIGDLGTSGPLDLNGNFVNLENTTVAPFTTAVQSDLYELRPSGSADPHTGLTNGAGYAVGYFQLNTNGSMTFTRASAVTVPSAGSVSSTVTNGFSPLKVVFTNSASSGSITSWVWNFGNGTIITNITAGDVTNTYATGGDYTVTLTVSGPGGSSTVSLANFIVASPSPKLLAQTLASGKLVLSGTNGPAGVQYRILTSTNLALAITNWIPVFTNTISSTGSYGYTNAATTNKTAYYRLVSP